MWPVANIQDGIANVCWASETLPRSQPFKVHDGNRRAVEQSVAWLYRLPEYEGDPKRALEFRGPRGTGKTHLMRCLSFLLTPRGSHGYFNSGFDIIKCDDIVQEFNNASAYRTKGEKGEWEQHSVGGDQVIMKYARMERVCFDDLGDEREGKHFGTPVNVIERILSKRGDLMSSMPMLTMFTTNLDKNDIDIKYGERVADRRLLMVRPFVISPDPTPGADPFRKQAVVLDWRKDVVSREPVENQVAAQAVKEFANKMDREKNLRRIEDGHRASARLREYLDQLRDMMRTKSLDGLVILYGKEHSEEGRKLIEQTFNNRSPVPLSQLIEEHKARKTTEDHGKKKD